LEKMLAEKEREVEDSKAKGNDESKLISSLKENITDLEARCEALLQGGDQAKSKEISKLMASQKQAQDALEEEQKSKRKENARVKMEHSYEIDEWKKSVEKREQEKQQLAQQIAQCQHIIVQLQQQLDAYKSILSAVNPGNATGSRRESTLSSDPKPSTAADGDVPPTVASPKAGTPQQGGLGTPGSPAGLDLGATHSSVISNAMLESAMSSPLMSPRGSLVMDGTTPGSPVSPRAPSTGETRVLF